MSFKEIKYNCTMFLEPFLLLIGLVCVVLVCIYGIFSSYSYYINTGSVYMGLVVVVVYTAAAGLAILTFKRIIEFPLKWKNIFWICFNIYVLTLVFKLI